MAGASVDVGEDLDDLFLPFRKLPHLGLQIDVEPVACAQLADLFFRAADLEVQPWYAQFRGGESRPLSEAPPAGIERRRT
mgnify:CR=1 FL=1